MKRSTWFTILVLFYFSGASGLIYEIVWVRIFSLVFGNTNYAATIVLSAFFVGLAVGSLFFGRNAHLVARPFRMYGFLEIGIGLSALAVPVLVSFMDGFYPSLYRALGEKSVFFFIIRFILSFAIVFIPTFFMGGTLPLIVKFTSMLKEEFGKSVSLLYALNTLGGVSGAFAAGFVLVRYLGINNTIAAAVVINVAVGIAALLFSRRFQAADIPKTVPSAMNAFPPGARAVPGDTIAQYIVIVAFITGMLSLSFQVVWARLLVYVLSSSVYAFNIMLTTFLFGIGLGSLVAGWIIAKSKNSARLCGVLLGLTGIYGLTTIPLMVVLAVNDEAIMSFFGFTTWSSYTVGRFFECAMILFIPSLLMGIVFPLIACIAKTRQESGSRVIGTIYFVNTLGAIVGSIAAGFILVPFVGCKGSIVLLSSAYVVTGLVVLLFVYNTFVKRVAAVTSALVLIGLSLVFLRGDPFIPLFNIREKGSEITYIREGTTGTVTVHAYPSYKVINVNRVNVAGTSFVLRTTQKLQAFVPLLVRKDPGLVCQIGFGSGETSSIVARYPGVERLDVVDISYEVFDAAPEFKDINHEVYKSEKVRKIVMDGKNYIHLTEEKYDLIMNDSIHPVECGNASLYTKEYFEDCKKRLKEDGVMSSWFPLFALDTKDFKSLIHTFNVVFPGCTLWVGNNCVNRHAVLVGRKDGKEVTIDFGFIRSLLNKDWIKRDLEDIRMHSIYDFLDSFMLNGEAVKEFTMGAEVNTDTRPILEYRSPTTLATDPVLLAGNISDLLKHRSNVFESLTNVPPEQLTEVKEVFDTFMKSTALIYQGHINDILGNYKDVVSNYARAKEINTYDNDGKYLIEEMRRMEAALSEKIEAGQETPEKLYELGMLHIKLGKSEAAKAAFELLHDLAPRNRTVMYWLFDLYQTLGAIQKQHQMIDKLLKVDKTPELYFQKGFFLGREGNFRESTEFFKKAIKMKDDDPRYYFYLGLSLETLGNSAGSRYEQADYYSKALQNYRKAEALDEKNLLRVSEYSIPLEQRLMGLY